MPNTKMNREKWEAIQAIEKPPQGLSQEEQWRSIWCIVFDDDEDALTSIPSPCKFITLIHSVPFISHIPSRCRSFIYQCFL